MEKMRHMIYKIPFSIIIMMGILIGVVKGQDVRQKWVSKMKNRYEEKKASAKYLPGKQYEIMLDEIELSTYHR